MIIDSHCHLSYKGNVEDINNVIQNANDVDVRKFLNIATDFNEFKNIINISSKYENVYYTLGIHPHEANQTSDLVIDEISNRSKKENYILDYNIRYNYLVISFIMSLLILEWFLRRRAGLM